jgi:uncharacterized membrane protein
MGKLRETLTKINLEAFEKTLGLKVFNVSLGLLLVGIAILIYAIVFSHFVIMKHYAFKTYAWDLGIFNQSFWTTLYDGKLFYSTVELLVNPSGSFFGVHFSPILVILLPFYAIYSAPQTLLVVQSFILAVGAVPLYKLTLHVSKYRVIGLVFVLVYLLYPPLQGINWFDFHVQSFLPLFFFSAVYFYVKQDWKPYLIFIVLALMCEEHVAMIVFFVGVYAILDHRKHLKSVIMARKLKDPIFLVSATTLALAVLWYLSVLWIRRTFFPFDPHFAYEFNATANWSVLGVQDPLLVPIYVFLHPTQAVAALGYDFLAKIAYLLGLFGPLALRPFFSPKHVLPTVPWFVSALFSNYSPYYSIFNQYPAYVITFLFVASVFAIIDEGETPNLKMVKKRLFVILFCSLIAFSMVSPLSPVVSVIYPDRGLAIATRHEELIREILAYVPSTASIMAQSNLFPHVSSRINSFVIPSIHPIWAQKETEFRDFANQTLQKVDYVLVDFASDPASTTMVFTLMQDNDEFGVFASAESIVLFKKHFFGNAIVLSPYTARYNYQTLTLFTGDWTIEPNSTSQRVLYFNGSFDYSPLFWYGPRTILPPANYNITLRLKANFPEINVFPLLTIEVCSRDGNNVFISKTIITNELVGRSIWTDYSLLISLVTPLVDFEVRAVNVSSQAAVYLDYIDVRQITS